MHDRCQSIQFTNTWSPADTRGTAGSGGQSDKHLPPSTRAIWDHPGHQKPPANRRAGDPGSSSRHSCSRAMAGLHPRTPQLGAPGGRTQSWHHTATPKSLQAPGVTGQPAPNLGCVLPDLLHSEVLVRLPSVHPFKGLPRCNGVNGLEMSR